MKHECPMVCDCTYSSGCRIEQASARVRSPHVSTGYADQQTPEPKPRKPRQYPGIRSFALQQTAQRREARNARRQRSTEAADAVPAM